MYCEHCFTESPNHHPRCIQCGKPFLKHEEISQQAVKAKPKGNFDILGWIAGLVVGWYSGIFILVLMACTFTISWLLKKMLKPDATIYLSAIAFQAGTVFMMTGSFLFIVFRTDISIHPDIFLIFDLVVPISGLIWLALNPGLKPVVFLTVYQASALIVNIYNFSSMEVGSSSHKALATYILWRLIALFIMWRSYISTKNTNGGTHEIPL